MSFGASIDHLKDSVFPGTPSPPNHSRWLDQDEREALQRHSPVLDVTPPQRRQGSGIGVGTAEDLCCALHAHPGELSPVVVVAVGEECHARIAPDVANAG